MDANVSEGERIENWNRELLYDLIPNDIVLAVYILLGIFGNGIVIYVYKKGFSRMNVERYFIPILAVADCYASTMCASFSMALNMMQATFYNNTLCKVWWFFAAFPTFLSPLLLLVIAVQRYLKVVRPFGRQMDKKLNRIALFLTIILSLLCALPTPLLYGSVPFPHAQENIVGRRCSKIKGGNRYFSIFYGSMLALIAITAVTALIVLYLKIGWAIYKHTKKEYTISRTGLDCQKSKVKTHGIIESISENKTEEMISSDTKTKDSTEKTIKPAVKEYCENGELTCYSGEARERRNRKIIHKFTLMFMLITTIFLICYIPKAVIMLFEALNREFWESFDDSDRSGMLFIYRLFIVNNIVNPFVYAFLDSKFKHELKMLFCQRH
ncbi:hypothetical protein FSP39_023953 [Pinctada imbricata]|uniref:G-protein coupled receptors family 1 profile domain-containing protein n=1 Tax=Pinctada imbricata TaxID=66713 RepID=A0AA89BPY3_PINIB|nr:hypothetical protein FSP39_023953 [Pinctada imbricata]